MKKHLVIFLVVLTTCTSTGFAQVIDQPGGFLSKRENFWNDWFVQAGLDMTLQVPYGYNLEGVFPNGKTFGLDVALGKWFSPQIGLRGKLNWENRLPLLENGHANWVAPFYEPGVNRRRGGYVALYGDVLIGVQDWLTSPREDRPWKLAVYPRIGVNYNFGVRKGSLLAAAGVLNTWRLTERLSLYADVAYQMTGSGFVGSERVESTGTGSNSNGYLTAGVGVQVDVGHRTPAERRRPVDGFWQNWFVQAGIDMSLMNPYGCRFADVFPKGQTYGLNAAVGKWFTPQLGLRARLQWENGLVENRSLEWVPPVDNPRENFSEHGIVMTSLDAMLSLTNIFGDSQPDRRWNTAGYVRAGLIQQLAISSASPLMGLGVEQTYRLTERLSLYANVGYQVTTSESSGGLTGMGVATGSNGLFDVGAGVVVNL